MARKKKLIVVKAEPVIPPMPIFLRHPCDTCDLFTVCKHIEHNALSQDLLKVCDIFKLGAITTWNKMIVQRSRTPEGLMKEMEKRFFDREDAEGFVNQN